MVEYKRTRMDKKAVRIRIQQKEQMTKYATRIRIYSKEYRKEYNENYYARNKDRLRVVQKAWKSRPATKARTRAYKAQPAQVEQRRIRNKERASRVRHIEKQYVTDFLRTHPDVPVTSRDMTEEQAHAQMLQLIDSTNPTIIERFNGMTIREAFFKRGMPYSSIYVYLSRGSGIDRRPGQSYAECERFLLSDPNPVLTQLDGKHYKANTTAYRELELRSMALV
ncbi:hypothetical protein T484DRAFT_1757730 [Baffinella frigidus]|nr:hypothetical protein T484DRAFT_1757730 [Cryptophyta sp. CCMP2293]